MKFKIGSHIVVHDPKDLFFPGHNFHGRIGQIISMSRIGSKYILIQFIRLIGDKFIGNKVNIPYNYTIIYEEISIIPINMNNNLIRLVCSTQ